MTLYIPQRLSVIIYHIWTLQKPNLNKRETSQTICLCVGEINSVDCSWTTKIDRPPWIDVTLCDRAPGPTTSGRTSRRSRMKITVIGQSGSVPNVTVRKNAALISRFVQCCVV